MCRENAALGLIPSMPRPFYFLLARVWAKAHDKFTIAMSTAEANDPPNFPNSFLDTAQDGKVPALSLRGVLQG